MRSFGAPISRDRIAEITAAIAEIAPRLPLHRDVTGADYLMEPDDMVVIHLAELNIKKGPRLRIGATMPEARPPFDWLYELSSDVTPADYFKHYLVLDDQIVLAHLKVLTPIDDVEADLIMADLAVASELLMTI
ncbi:hypothetical protein HJC99_05495 [Candidatus Saccharibacteria bacterium]|nr:hypothetical protein [Candidatus Saccharibacteria bacterium]